MTLDALTPSPAVSTLVADAKARREAALSLRQAKARAAREAADEVITDEHGTFSEVNWDKVAELYPASEEIEDVKVEIEAINHVRCVLLPEYIRLERARPRKNAKAFKQWEVDLAAVEAELAFARRAENEADDRRIYLAKQLPGYKAPELPPGVVQITGIRY
jgi:hypothetical protein